MQRILLTGATGFIGRALIDRLLLRGDVVTAFSRSPHRSTDEQASLRWLTWDPLADGPWQSEIDGQDAVIHLAGESVAGRRYTEAVRRDIVQSRVAGTQRLVAAIAKSAKPPRTLVSASAVGYYGPQNDPTPLDETAAPGRDFLARVCVDWEGAARDAERHGVRVVITRLGLVLGRNGGALARILPAFKAFVGGRLGSGEQMMSWIHLEDVVGAILHAIGDPTLLGPVNTVAPSAVSNREFTEVLARALGRPAILPVPGFALRALFGQGAEPLLSGQHVIPRVLLEHGFPFRFPELGPALQNILGG